MPGPGGSAVLIDMFFVVDFVINCRFLGLARRKEKYGYERMVNAAGGFYDERKTQKRRQPEPAPEHDH